jgi:hypothetical protein
MRNLRRLLVVFLVLAGGAYGQIILPNSLGPVVSAAGPGSGSAAVPFGSLAMPLQQVGEVDFAKEQEDLNDLQLREDQTATATVTVISKKKEPVNALQFYVDLSESPGFSPCTVTAAALTADTALKQENEWKRIPLVITSCNPNGGKGALAILGSTGQKRMINITLKKRRSGWLTAAVAGSLGIAVVLCAVCGIIVFHQGHKMADRMGQASWDFGSSWASNITAFGAAFTFVLQLSVFPDKPFFGTRLEYMFVAAFATALVAFAPAVHRMVSAPPANATANGAPPTPEGLVAGFLVASAFTVWGALLQTGLELLIILDLIKTFTIYRSIGALVEVCVAGTAIGLIFYCAITILSTIAANATHTGTRPKEPMAMFAAPAPGKAKRVSVL